MTPPNKIISYGLCKCGCGMNTSIARESNHRYGWIKGTPHDFLPNHRKRILLPMTAAIAIDREGEKCFLVPLTQCKQAIISSHRLAEVMRFKWRARKNTRSDTWYAMRTKNVNGRNITVLMHNFILGINAEIDHRNMDGLDNRDCNLRASNGKNQFNISLKSNNTSGYKGVSWHRVQLAWSVNIQANGKRIFLGYYSDKMVAATIYDAAAIGLHGEFARLNFPPQQSMEGRY